MRLWRRATRGSSLSDVSLRVNSEEEKRRGLKSVHFGHCSVL